MGTLFLLIDADIVDFVAHREGIGLRFASVDSTNGKVEKDVLGLVERIGVVTDGTIDGVEGGDVVEKFAIKIDTDSFGIPIHRPDMEFLCPVGVFLEEMGERDALGVPHSIVRTVVAPCCSFSSIEGDSWRNWCSASLQCSCTEAEKTESRKGPIVE